MLPNTAPAASDGPRKISAPIGQRFAQGLRSYSADTRTVDLVVATETMVRMPGWYLGLAEDFYYEILDCGPDAVDLSQVRADNCPVLDAHSRWSVKDQLGKLRDGRCENREVIATCAFGQSEGARAVEAEVAAGTPPKVSAGYRREQAIFERFEGEVPVYRITRWTLCEGSFVPIAADPNAGVRAGDATVFPCFVQERTLSMDPETNPAAATIPQLRHIAAGAATSYGMRAGDVADIVLDMAERGLSEGDARSHVLQALGRRQSEASGAIGGGGRPLGNGGDDTFDNPAFQGRAIEDAIYARLSGKPPSEPARAFMGLSMVQMAGDMLARAGVRDVHRMSAASVIESASWNRVGARAAFVHGSRATPGHTTSDFPDLLTGAGQRYLIDVFAIAGSAIKTVCRTRQVADFREISGLQLSNFSPLEEIAEDGLIYNGTFHERKERYRVRSFGKYFVLTLQAMVNDDLNAFADNMALMSRAAAEKEAEVLTSLLVDNPIMGDGKTVFHTDHGNLAGAGAAPSENALDAARIAMRMQKDLNGEMPISAVPKYILGAPQQETAIEKLLAAITPASSANVNPFAGKLEPLIDPRLPAGPWYLFADPYAAPVLEYAHLEGRPGPIVEMQEGWRTLGQEFRVQLHFGAGAIDHRGAYRNPGA